MKLVANLLAKLTKQISFTLKKADCLQDDFNNILVLRFQVNCVLLVSAGFGKLKKALKFKAILGLGLSYDTVSS